jgi:FkbM family methyltransferase
MRRQVRFAIELAKNHPFASEHRLVVLSRLLTWRLQTIVGRGAVVDFESLRLSFYCPPEWRGTAKLAYLLREHLEPELSALQYVVGRRGVAIDVGAHYGSYTVVLARLFNRVHAIEPEVHAREILTTNLSVNGLKNVSIHAVAAGARSSSAVLRRHPDPSRTSIEYIDGTPYEVPAESVAVVRLDDLLDEPVDFLKVDVEGFEQEVFMGARSLICACRPIILFEWLPELIRNAGLDPLGPWEYLANLGYRFSQLRNGHEWRPLAHPEDSQSSNILATWYGE